MESLQKSAIVFQLNELDAMIDHLVAIYAANKLAPRRTLVALAGVPGSGKTTIASVLAAGVNNRVGREVCSIVGMDGFHLTRKQLDAMPNPETAHKRRGVEWTFDPVGLSQVGPSACIMPH